MSSSRSLAVALACVVLLPACITSDADEVDRSANFYGARVRKELDSDVPHRGKFVELSWTALESDEAELDTSLHTVTLGLGVDGALGERGFGGAAAGLAWQASDFDSPTDDLDTEDDYGPYVAIHGGWSANEWLELFARADVALFLDEFSTMFSFEAGPRLHFLDHTALFLGWRYARHDVRDLDGALSLESIEIDASGLVLGLELSF